MPQDSAADLGRLIADLRSAMPAAAPDTEPVPVTTTAADGLIEIVAAPDGRIETVTIDPRAMRLPSQTLAEELRTALNAAHDELRAAASATAGVPDPAALAARLQEMQETSIQQMRTFTQAIADAQQRLSARRSAQP